MGWRVRALKHTEEQQIMIRRVFSSGRFSLLTSHSHISILYFYIMNFYIKIRFAWEMFIEYTFDLKSHFIFGENKFSSKNVLFWWETKHEVRLREPAGGRPRRGPRARPLCHLCRPSCWRPRHGVHRGRPAGERQLLSGLCFWNKIFRNLKFREKSRKKFEFTLHISSNNTIPPPLPL